MSQNYKDKDESVMKGLQHYAQITSRVASVTLGTMALFAAPAYFLDEWLGTWPMFFVGAIILALPLSQYLVYKVMSQFVNNKPS